MRLFRTALSRSFTLGTLSLGVLVTLLCDPVLAARLPNNRVVFDRAPTLAEASVLPSTQTEDGQLQLVIEVPVDAGEPLEALVVQPRREGSGFAFDPTATTAYLSQPSAEVIAVPLASVGGVMMSPDQVLVVFANPIEPGNQVTVVLHPQHPPVPGLYQFGVTAYPAGDSPVGQFLGYEVIQF